MGGEKGKANRIYVFSMSVQGVGLLGFSDNALCHIPKKGKYKNGDCLTANSNAIPSSFLTHKCI